VKGPTLGQFMENCLLWKGPYAGAGAECEEEGAAEKMCDELTTTPIPRPPVPLGGRRERKSGVKLSPGSRDGSGQGVLRFGFTAHYPSLI